MTELTLKEALDELVSIIHTMSKRGPVAVHFRNRYNPNLPECSVRRNLIVTSIKAAVTCRNCRRLLGQTLDD